MLTVLLATHNGARTLPTVLEGYCRIEAPAGGWKLVIVDNASRDETPELLRRFEPRLPLTVLAETRPGKNRALNTGLAAVEGDLVVLTDDDAVPAQDWLVQMQRAAAAQPDFDIFGGTIVPRWEREPERWLLDWVPQGVTYTLTSKTQPEGPVGAGLVWGPNMAVRARVFEAGQRFADTIGPTAGVSYAMGSETEFTLRLESLGYRAWFVRAASVEHMIRDFQMDRAWILRRAERYGRGVCRRDLLRGDPAVRGRFGMPAWLLRRIATRAVAWSTCMLSANRRGAFENAWELRRDWGYLAEARAAREDAR